MLKCSGRVPCRFAARQLASVSMGLGLRAFYKKQKNAPPCRVNGRAGRFGKGRAGQHPCPVLHFNRFCRPLPAGGRLLKLLQNGLEAGRPVQKGKIFVCAQRACNHGGKIGPKICIFGRHMAV